MAYYESGTQEYILQMLNKIENSEWEKATVTNKAGSPDIKGHIEGKYIAIEVKRDEFTGPNELQKYRINKTIEKGGIAFWTFSWKDTINKLREYSKTAKFSVRFRHKDARKIII